MPTSLTDAIEAKTEIRNRLIRVPTQGKRVSMGHAWVLPAHWGLEGHLVHAIGVGRKVVQGRETEELAVRLYVVTKLPKKALSRKLRLKESIDGIPTDVIQSAPAIGYPAMLGNEPPEDGGIERWQLPTSPICAGVSVSHGEGRTGTISYIFAGKQRYAGRVLFLSNNHVLANTNQGRPGDRLFHPGREHKDMAAVGTLLKYKKLKFNRAENFMDVALGELSNVDHVCAIYGGLEVIGVDSPNMNDIVWKHGRTTGKTEGRIVDISVDPVISYEVKGKKRQVLFVNQTRVEASTQDVFAKLGDSGSLLVKDGNKRAVGLIFAVGSDFRYAYANPIQPILSEFDLEIP